MPHIVQHIFMRFRVVLAGDQTSLHFLTFFVCATAQIVAGIGFLGAGAIIKRQGDLDVIGITTAVRSPPPVPLSRRLVCICLSLKALRY